MQFPSVYISAGAEYADFSRFVPAPYLRKVLTLRREVKSCRVLVTGLGFYRLWVNGREITKGILAPYISNPDHFVYFDRYEIASYLREGENVLGFQLGNGMQNCPGGTVWQFEKAPWRGAPKLSFAVDIGAVRVCEADETVKTAPSPVLFDDLRCGVHCDARKEIPGWNLPGFDDSGWKNAVIAPTPLGEPRICEAEPVRPTGRVLRPVSVKPAGIREGFSPHDWVKKYPADASMSRTGLLFDFGENNAGVPRLHINGLPGQKIEMQFAEFETDGNIDYTNINFFPDGFAQRDVYICGGGEETFIPPFTYHGFRYCLVSGLTPAQVTPDVLEYVVCTSDIPAAGRFACSDETANTLYEMAERSDRANFYYFPTDCPHREKNGWTGDAALSSSHMLKTMQCEKSLAEWLRNVRAAQLPNGFLPCVVPAGKWGENGCGPSWDAVLTEIPYQIWLHTGSRQTLSDCADSIARYLGFGAGKRSTDGLVDYGLGDWCPVDGCLKVCTEFTNSVALMDMAGKGAFIFGLLGQKERETAARAFAGELRSAIRKKYIRDEQGLAESGSQSAQALAVYYKLFDSAYAEKKAIGRLLDVIHESGDHLDVGLLGARVLFHVLGAAGEAELAYKMITRPDYPSYGHFIEAGLTAIPESFEVGYELPGCGSACHHMYADIKGWFITDVAGLDWQGCETAPQVRIRPAFIEKLSFAEASFISPFGEVFVRWQREGEKIRLTVRLPEGVTAACDIPFAWENESPLPETGCSETVFIPRIIE